MITADRIVAVAKLAEPDEGDEDPQAELPVSPPVPGGESKAQGPKLTVGRPQLQLWTRDFGL